MDIVPPEGMDEVQYIAAEVLREAVESKELQAHAANHLLRKGLQLGFDYFMEGQDGTIKTRLG
jgi:hypothetical protein